MDTEIAALKAEIERLRTEGTPGVMHEIDRAFYKLTVKERDLERQAVDRLAAENERLRNAITDVLTYSDYFPRHGIAEALRAALDGTDQPQTTGRVVKRGGRVLRERDVPEDQP